MEQTADKEIEKIIKFLFNDLNEEEAIEIGEKIFSVEGFAEKIEALKSKLIDSYILEQMSELLKKEFEEKFLNTFDGRREVEETRILREELHKLRTAESYVVEPVKTDAGWFGLSKSAGFAAIMILLFAGFAGAIIFYYKLKSDEIAKIIDSNTITPIPMPSETQTIKVSNDNKNRNTIVTPTKTPKETPKKTPKETFKPIFATLLPFGGFGGGEIVERKIPKGAPVILTLVIKDSIELDSKLSITIEGEKISKIFKPIQTEKSRIIRVEVDENRLKIGSNKIEVFNENNVPTGEYVIRRR